MESVLLDGWQLVKEASSFKNCREAFSGGLDSRFKGGLGVDWRLLKGGEGEALPKGQRVLLRDPIQQGLARSDLTRLTGKWRWGPMSRDPLR